LFAIPALDVLSGAPARHLPFLSATLAEAVKEKANLAHFLPAHLEWRGLSPYVSALRSQGSGDISALSGANCFLLVPDDRLDISVGEKVSVLPRLDVL